MNLMKFLQVISYMGRAVKQCLERINSETLQVKCLSIVRTVFIALYQYLTAIFKSFRKISILYLATAVEKHVICIFSI